MRIAGTDLTSDQTQTETLQSAYNEDWSSIAIDRYILVLLRAVE